MDFTYIFGIGVAFAIWDAIGCGANDVANAFATAVNSKTLTMRQAMMIATVMELLGAMTLGSYNASTIRGSIINTVPFKDNLYSLMLAMMCVVASSSTLNFLSNKYGWATSSTHAIIGALIGVGVASGAGVTWGYVVTTSNGAVTGQNGLGAVIASFAISPILAGLISALIFAVIKFGILRRSSERSFWWALRVAPFIYATVAGFEAWLIGWKSPRLPALTDNQTIALYFGTFGCVLVLVALFVTPYMRRKIWLGWKNIELWHMPLMVLPDALLARLFPRLAEVPAHFDTRHLRGEAIPADEAWQWSENDMMKLARSKGMIAGAKVVGASDAKEVTLAIPDAETGNSTATSTPAATPRAADASAKAAPVVGVAGLKLDEHGVVLGADGKPLSAWKSKKAIFKAQMADPALGIFTKARLAASFVFFIGVDREIADWGHDREDIQSLHSEDVAERYYGKTEQVFRFLQVLTSSVASFAHGANDVALSVGPIATMYSIWSNGTGRGSPPRSSVVLDWQLAVGGLSLVIGLWTYGYNMMRVLGNRLTYHSPARGFSMELGAAITVLIAARNGIPVSTTNCIVGATAGVGLMNANLKAVNWKLFAFTVFTWCLTVPFCALLSGLLYAFVAYSPQARCDPFTVVAPAGVRWMMLNSVNTTVTAGQTYKVWPTSC